MGDYYSVSEYAKIVGKDPGNIRRKLINGELKGEKIGSQWVIPKGTVYPADKRVVTGVYHNSRKRSMLYKKHPEIMKKITQMSKEIGELYKSDAESIIMYGSYTRGEETEESDVDIAIMIDHEEDEMLQERVADIVIDYELDLGITLSVITIEKANYDEWKGVLPFYKNILKEGVVLWKERQNL